MDDAKRPCAQEVRLYFNCTIPMFLARFREIAAQLGPEEGMHLAVCNQSERNIKFLKAVLADKQAKRVSSLDWRFDGKQDVCPISALIASRCPELASLQVNLTRTPSLDFVSNVLERVGNKLVALNLTCAVGNVQRFFSALRQSQVTRFSVSECDSPEFLRSLGEYLQNDILTSLSVSIRNDRKLLKTIALLETCTQLTELKFTYCTFRDSLDGFDLLPKSLIKLEFDCCRYFHEAAECDWSFLLASNVQCLRFHHVEGIDGHRLGQTLRATGLQRLSLYKCNFAKQMLAAMGSEVSRVQGLELGFCNLDNSFLAPLSLALQAPTSQIRCLVLPYNASTAHGYEAFFLPVLKHPNCKLSELAIWDESRDRLEYLAIMDRVESEFAKVCLRRCVLVLLQAQQVQRKPPNQLRRLPVEMFRLVGAVLV